MAISIFRKETSDFDEADWLDYVPTRRGRRFNGESNGIAKLFGLLLLALTGLGILAATTLRVDGGETLWESIRGDYSAVDGGTYGGIDFGISPEAALRARPDMNLTGVAGGEMAGVYSWQGVRFTVGFGAVNGTALAYRFHSNRSIGDDEAETFLSSLVRRYGPPMHSDCGQRVFAPVRFCHFGWLTEGGVALNITSKPLAGSIQKRSELTVVARHTYLDNKRRGTALAAR